MIPPVVALVAALVGARPASAYDGGWVQSFRPTDLWSGVDSGAVSFGQVPQWSHFYVVAPQQGPRLHVLDPRTDNCAFVDASAVGPSSAPSRAAAVETGPKVPEGYEPWWVQTPSEATIWSGPDARAISFGTVPRWSHFQVVAPAEGSRLYVLDPRTNNYAYMDEAEVWPNSPIEVAVTAMSIGPAEPARKSPSVAQGFKAWWVANFEETELWMGPEKAATSLERVPQFRRFLVVEPQKGERLKVWSPEKGATGYLDSAVAGPSDPSVWMEAHSTRTVKQVRLSGRVVGDRSYVRNLPVYSDETELGRVAHNSVVDVREMVVAGDGTQWYTVGEGEYILVSEVRLPRQAEQSHPGRWIEADLSEPAMVTAYEGNKMVYSALAIKGVTAMSTPRGTFRIERRVENETMDSETLGIPRNSPEGYFLKDVLYTQYFTDDGAALHFNYWLGRFGYPGSHGCLGLNLKDARWFWDWASVGTTVVIR